LTNLIQRCWHQDPAKRPNFQTIVDELVELEKLKVGTLFCVVGIGCLVSITVRGLIARDVARLAGAVVAALPSLCTVHERSTHCRGCGSL
jgi:hypothetical protein